VCTDGKPAVSTLSRKGRKTKLLLAVSTCHEESARGFQESGEFIDTAIF
jgi:hypothetical protein